MLPGVFRAKKKDGTEYFRSSITFKGKHISLGSFPTEASASKAYRLADKILHDYSYTMDSLPADMTKKKNMILSFSKWIVLLNFRDNNMYIKTPIYLRKNFFHYYFSKDDFLTFDIDDLFYYSTRTISRRGGHLFVADYGMQVNILSRYGIKNYAVEGRDFRFINGDTKDFRYANIEIINRFHGVCRREVDGTEFFEAKIHWNGDFIVGRYPTETEAAVAYNAIKSQDEEGINLDERNTVLIIKTNATLKTIDKIMQTHPEHYLRLKRLLEKPEFKGKVEAIAIPFNVEIPDWIVPFINYTEIIHDNLRNFRMEEIGLSKMENADVTHTNMLVL